jgi:uncharacterized protein YukE
MSRSSALAGFLFAVALLTCAAKSSPSSQDAATASSQGQNPASAAPQTPPQDSTIKPGSKKTKKVWTNDNLSDASGPISVVGDAPTAAKPQSKTLDNKPADPKLVANLRQQLGKLQAQLAQLDKQLADLKDFSKGESRSSGGLHQDTWQYNSSSVDEQLRNLQTKKNQIQAAIDGVFDDARRQGIEPGQLR